MPDSTIPASPALSQQSLGADGPRVTRIAFGCMGLTGIWNAAEVGPSHVRQAVVAFEAAMEAGITLYDHADIYGGGSCEFAFKDCLAAVPGARERIYIATKGGLGGRYNLSYDHLNVALARSLTRLGLDYVDLYQVHRPDPLTHPAETARALNEFLRQGRVRHIGVSNYYPEQVRALQRYLDAPIRSNQIAISLRRLDPIYEGLDTGRGRVGDGTLDQCMALQMTPLAYSPLGQGILSRPAKHDAETLEADPKLAPLLTELQAQADKRGTTRGQIALAWLLAHPAGIIPVFGSANPAHIREAAGADRLALDREDWSRLWTAAWGRNAP